MFAQEEKYGPRLVLTLCYVSSEDDAHPADALRMHQRNSCGWQSAKHCGFPQELGFRFEGQVFLDYIRVLSHESKISSCIDILVAEASETELASGLCHSYAEATFKRLGHVRFSPNTESHNRARELKTIGVRHACVYLKLLFRRPHTNMYNVFQQVGVVALTAHGQLQRSLNAWSSCACDIRVGECVEAPLDEMLPPRPEEPPAGSTSESGDAGAAHGADDESAGEKAAAAAAAIVTTLKQRMDELRELKTRAIAEEDYDLAEALKQQLSTIEAARQRIVELETAKTAAVAAEDYQRAKELKKKIDALQQASFQTRPGAAVVGRPHGAADAAPARDAQRGGSSRAHGRPSPAQGDDNDDDDDDDKSPVRAPRAPTAAMRRGDTTAADGHDEVVVGGKGYYDVSSAMAAQAPSGSPARRASTSLVDVAGHGAEWERTLNEEIVKGANGQAPSTLSGAAAQAAAEYERTFGVYCTACLFGQRGQLREAAIRGIVSSAGWRAVCAHTGTATEQLLRYLTSKSHGVGDAAAGAVLASCDALQQLLRGALPGSPPLSQLSAVFAKLIVELVGRLGDANARVREALELVVTDLAQSQLGPDDLVAQIVASFVSQSKSAAGARAYLSRLHVLTTLVDAYGVDPSENAGALSTSALLTKVIQPSLQHANAEVRMAAGRLLAKLVLLDNRACTAFMAGVKPAQLAYVQEQVRAMRDEQAGRRNDEGPEMATDTVSIHKMPSPKARQTPPSQQQQQQAPSQPRPASHTPSTPTQQPGRRSPAKVAVAAQSEETDETAPHDAEYRALHTCQFCGEFNANFNEVNLDYHYVRECPMLCPCPLCDQVTEICTLQQHLVNECEGRRLVRECPRCHEAVQAEDIKAHIAAQSCIEAVPTHSVCPLCHARFRSGMEGWRRHLAMAPGCINNPRKYDGSGPVEM